MGGRWILFRCGFLLSLSLLLRDFFFVKLLYYCCDGRFQPRILILYLSCVDRSHSSPFEDSTTQFTMFKELRLYSFGSLIIKENESDFFTLSLTISPHIFESDLKKTLLKFKISLQWKKKHRTFLVILLQKIV